MKFKTFLISILFLEIFFLFLFIVGAIGAAPAITGASGTLAEGTSLTVTGSGFGATGPTVAFFENFESGTSGANIAAGAATVGSWNRGNPGYATFTAYSGWPHGGTKCMMNNWDVPVAEPNNVDAAPKVTFTATDEIYYQFWTMVPSGKVLPGDDCTGGNPYGCNWKLTWMNYGVNTYVSAVVLNCTLTWGYWFGNDGYERAGDYEGTFQMAAGTWTRFDFYHKASSATTGILTGNELDSVHGLVNHINVTGVKTAMEAGNVYDYLLIPGYGRGQTTNGITVYDDVYIARGTGARARVEVGDAATYVTCKNLTTLTVDSWANTSITATVRKGSFSSLTDKYLYVIDSSGVSNTAGYQLTEGAPGCSPCSICP